MTSGLRRSLVAILIIALTFAGLGRAFASFADLRDAIPGVHVPICHSGPGRVPVGPAQPASHACCDDCALLAPAVLPGAPTLSGPAAIEHFIEHAHALAWAPALSRPRDPRLSRGPPAA